MRTRSDDIAARQLILAMAELPPPLADIVAKYDEDTDYLLWAKFNRDWQKRLGFEWTNAVIAASDFPGWLISRRSNRDRDAFIVTISPHGNALETADDVWDFIVSGLPTPAMRSLFRSPADGPSTLDARSIKALHVDAIANFAQLKLKVTGRGTHHTA